MTVLQQEWVALFLSLIAALLISAVAWRAGYFILSLESSLETKKVRLFDFLGAFALYFFVGQLFLFHLFSNWEGEAEPTVWAVIAAGFITTAAVAVYYSLHKSAVRRSIWGTGDQEDITKKVFSFFWGTASWLIVFPWILFNTQLATLLFQWLGLEPTQEQVAVKLLKQSAGDPLQLILMTVSVVLIVPWTEELLFRGFFLNWLKGVVGTYSAIFISALFFALFHFSVQQGYENVSVISSLFLLGCFLGFVKEKRRSLWAPIGLHAAFNLIGSLTILGGF